MDDEVHAVSEVTTSKIEASDTILIVNNYFGGSIYFRGKIMNREIKFRAWDHEQGEMVFGDALDFSFVKHVSYDSRDASTLMQFTGLKDRNGVEIYEGDVITYPNDLYKMFRAIGWQGDLKGRELIFWDSKATAFLGKDLNCLDEGLPLDLIKGRYLFIMDLAEQAEVVGNICANPELTEKETK